MIKDPTKFKCKNGHDVCIYSLKTNCPVCGEIIFSQSFELSENISEIGDMENGD
jgi:hypothetical protein